MQALSNQQRLHLVNTQQLYSNYVAAQRHARSHAYGMRWKLVRGVEYLFRERDRRGNGKLLGRRSPETEQILAQKQGFRAANAGQFMVDLIVSPRPMHEHGPITFGVDDLVASEVPGLQWLVNSPELEAVAVDEDGRPAPFCVPDPRAFALHKAWLSRQPDREPVKKPRDIAQAQEVAQLVREHMPHLSFDEAITSLHGDVRAMRELLNV